MPTDCIPYLDTPFFSTLIRDYLSGASQLQPFYSFSPTPEALINAMPERSKRFSREVRDSLCEELARQYRDLDIPEALLNNLNALSSPNSLTVTTGHQLNLFGGPLYFIYKIITVINLAERLNNLQKSHRIVPVFWMATEDHDFEEINFFRFQGEKISWNRPSGGAVGRLDTEGLEEVFEYFKSLTGRSINAQKLQSLFEEAYLKHTNLADATRYLVHHLFADKGLIVLDADRASLKKHWFNILSKEIREETTFHHVEKTSKELKALGYHKQVNPRHINIFYLLDKQRVRIERDPQKGFLYTEGTESSYSDSDLLKEAQIHPENFSPNALLRPIYQETVLPNLVYAGGAGELAYWLQLKSTFEAFQVPFPALLHRNSAMVMAEKQLDKIYKAGLEIEAFFRPKVEVINTLVKQISEIPIDFSPQKSFLEKQFSNLYQIAEKTDASFLGAVKAQEVKQKKGLQNLEKRLLKAQKRKLTDQTERMARLHEALFPGGNLQERYENFSTVYLHQGSNWFEKLYSTFDPFEMSFYIIKYS